MPNYIFPKRLKRVLASGSDDLKIILWDPFEQKLLNSIETAHRGNIFSVKFLPCNNSLVASCAADRDIYVRPYFCKRISY